MRSTPTLVLVFSKRTATNAGKLHSSACPQVKRAEGMPIGYAVIREGVALEVADLKERSYGVKRCPCAAGLKLEGKP